MVPDTLSPCPSLKETFCSTPTCLFLPYLLQLLTPFCYKSLSWAAYQQPNSTLQSLKYANLSNWQGLMIAIFALSTSFLLQCSPDRSILKLLCNWSSHNTMNSTSSPCRNCITLYFSPTVELENSPTLCLLMFYFLNSLTLLANSLLYTMSAIKLKIPCLFPMVCSTYYQSHIKIHFLEHRFSRWSSSTRLQSYLCMCKTFD